ncbi:MAG TPA: zinc-dependent alcohol dehydrogenase family protein [Mycobacteriales bacterium]|nr:zinc-dependent alcohol dehydrogenase family protein [Mycobacteriales bacterium]
MRATVFHAPGDVRVENVPDPRIESPTDAIVRVEYACICGSDLWFYRGVNDNWQPGWRTGHEFTGVVEEVGAEVTGVRPGDRVLAPFSFSDGTCEFCAKGVHTSCLNGGYWGGDVNDGGQGEAVRVPQADGTLVVVPESVSNDPALLRAAVPLTDVMATGHHAAVAAGVRKGGTVAVVGDGAVGLCGVLAAARLGAERIFALGHHDDRLAIARSFGATDLVTARDEEAVAAVLDATRGGAGSVLECVGAQSSMDLAIGIARPGGRVGFVGVPAQVGAVDIRRMFSNNIALHGGVAPARAYIPELLADVAAGRLDPSPVLDRTVGLDGVPDGYAAMDGRTATKVLVEVAPPR